MRLRSIALFTLCACTVLSLGLGQQPAPEKDLSGNWILSADLFGTTVYLRMELKQDGEKLSGKYTGDKVTMGTVSGGAIHLLATSDDGTKSDVNATLKDGVITGNAIETDPSDKDHPSKYTFTATRVVASPHGTPQRHEFTPTVFYRQFSRANKPVLTIAPGDTVHTTTVDAGGTDEKGVKRVLGGNPETGPFYVDGAQPGDTLVVHLLKLRLNRDYAVSDDAIDERAMNSQLAVTMKDAGKTVRWHIDTAQGGCVPRERRTEHMANYRCR